MSKLYKVLQTLVNEALCGKLLLALAMLEPLKFDSVILERLNLVQFSVVSLIVETF